MKNEPLFFPTQWPEFTRPIEIDDPRELVDYIEALPSEVKQLTFKLTFNLSEHLVMMFVMELLSRTKTRITEVNYNEDGTVTLNFGKADKWDSMQIIFEQF